MAANYLGLFFLILGTTGISVATAISFYRNERYPPRLGLFPIHNMHRSRGKPETVQIKTKFCENFKLLHKYAHPLCESTKTPSNFRSYVNSNRQIYPEWQKLYSRDDWFKKYVVSEPKYRPQYRLIEDFYESSENPVSTTHRSNTDEREMIKRQNLFNYIQTTSSFNELKNPRLPDIYSKLIVSNASPATTNNEFDLHMTGKTISDFKISPKSSKDAPLIQTTSNSDFSQTVFKTTAASERNSSPAMIKQNVDMVESKTSFTTSKNSSESGIIESFAEIEEIENSTKLFTDIYTKSEESQNSYTDEGKDQLTSLRSNSVTPYSETPETKDKYKPEESNIQAKSTAFQKLSSIVTTEATYLKDESKSSAITETADEQSSKMFTPLDEKLISSVDVQPTNSKYSKSESTIFQSSSFSSTDEDISGRMESSSSEYIHSKNTENFKTEPTTSKSSSTIISDDTDLVSTLISSSETKSATAETSEMKSTTQNFVPSGKATPITFPNKITGDNTKETVSTKSSTKVQFLPIGIPQDHVIEISSIRTARIVITSMFLVIALIALAVLAIYIFRMRRREVQYDQLMLIS